jgi:hypothetical protein
MYREGEGIPRFRRPRYIPASDTSSEPQLKKQKQDHTVDAGNNCEPDSNLFPPWTSYSIFPPARPMYIMF